MPRYPPHDSRSEPADTDTPQPRAYVPRPGVSQEVARELGEMSARISALEGDVDELKNKADKTGRQDRERLERELKDWQEKDRVRKEREADDVKQSEKERVQRRNEWIQRVMLLLLGAGVTLAINWLKDCRPPAPPAAAVVVVPPIPTAAPTSSAK